MKHTVLITGPTSGIGLSLAHLFARSGYNLILVARYKETLDALEQALIRLYGVNVQVYAIDLSKQGCVEQLLEQLGDQANAIDILVNNAGFGNYGRFEETDSSTDVDLIMLNILTLTMLTKALLPYVRARCGKILNVGSVAAFLPGPFMNTYFASKAYVLSFSLALREEVSSQGVSVSCLCPGPTHTNFGKRAHYDHQLSRQHIMDVDSVAQEAYRGLMAGKAIIVPGWKNRLIVALSPLTPRVLLAKIVRRASGY